jgi:hypothetical protein
VPDQTVSRPASVSNPLGSMLSVVPSQLAHGAITKDWLEYVTDAYQRGVLYLDVLRRRGNEEEEIAARPMATVLHFDHEVLMSGRSFRKPINFALSRIVPPRGVEIDPHKRPVVVVDPRAGQGPGIGGFKTQSEIGDALAAGHAVYFLGFAATPEPGQQFLDVVEGQLKFLERVVEMHPDAPRPFVIGNCQAGYQVLMAATLRPDLFGPCLVAGSPMSYWQGVHGKNPMRYAGGLLGGSWMTALTSDLGNGKFDGTWLIMNFDKLNPANWLWGKQYNLYANVDTEAERYLGFEKWWGDFIELGGDEMQFLVDQLFIGDRLTRNQLRSSDGTTFDLRNVTSPIIVFTSMGDNISPPPQSLGWILDLYRDVDDIRATGRTIVYCLNPTVGHLAIFVSSKVAAKEDEEMVRLMDLIDCLPPGLYEMVISPRDPAAASGTGAWTSRFEARTLDDIRALGRNSEADDRAFATVARMSELFHSMYCTFLQPAVRAMASEHVAELARKLHPMRLGYTTFADSNPLMRGVEDLAAEVKAMRQPAELDNPFLKLQKQMSDQIVSALDAYRDARDRMQEELFFAIFGSPVLQGLFGLNIGQKVRELPGTTPAKRAAEKAQATAYRAKLDTGGFDEALVRAVLYVVAAERALDERCAHALYAARKGLRQLPLDRYKILVRDQLFVLLLERERAVEALATLVREPDQRAELLRRTIAVIGAGGPPTAAEHERITRLEKLLTAPVAKRVAVAAPNRGAVEVETPLAVVAH